MQDFLADSSAEELVSPLLLSLLDSRKDSPDLVEKLLVRMLFLVEDRDTFLTIVKEAAKGAKELLSCLSSSLDAPVQLTVEEALAQPAWVLVQAHLGHLLHLARSQEEEEQELVSLLTKAPEETRRRLVKILLAKNSFVRDFDPYLSAVYDPSEPTSANRGCEVDTKHTLSVRHPVLQAS